MRSSSSKRSAKLILLTLQIALAIGGVVSSQDESPGSRQLSQRTTWPTQAGTMVRILKKSSNDFDLRNSFMKCIKDVLGEEKTNSGQRAKRNLFLRTSRSSSRMSQDNLEDIGNPELDLKGLLPSKIFNLKRAQDHALFFRDSRAVRNYPYTVDDEVDY